MLHCQWAVADRRDTLTGQSTGIKRPRAQPSMGHLTSGQQASGNGGRGGRKAMKSGGNLEYGALWNAISGHGAAIVPTSPDMAQLLYRCGYVHKDLYIKPASNPAQVAGDLQEPCFAGSWWRLGKGELLVSEDVATGRFPVLQRMVSTPSHLAHMDSAIWT